MADETQIDRPGSPAAGDSSAWLIGQHLNDSYVVDRLIKTGGMGEVYEGRNLQTGESVAIKLILPKFAADDKFMELFRHEARMLERIAHDALVKYRTLAFDRTVGRHYLVTEFVYGPSILDVLHDRPCQPATVRKVLKRLASGLAAAHAVGITHRDISPDNILLPEGLVENAKVIDFGIGQDMRPGRDQLMGSAFAGKWGYAAPEVFGRFDRQIGPWSDVYSLALTVLALARGRPLDMGHSIIEALERRDDVPDLDWLDGNLKGVFRPMLMPDPAKRLRSMDQVLEALAVVVDPERLVPDTPPPQAARVDTASVATAPQSIRRRVAIAAAVAAMGGAAIFGVMHSKTPAPSRHAPVVSSVSGEAPVPATAATLQRIGTVLGGVACGDVWTDDAPGASAVRLHGWRRAGIALPVKIEGVTLDTADVVDAPITDDATCDRFMALRRKLSGGGRLLVSAKTVAYRPGGNPGRFGPVAAVPADSLVYYRVWRVRGGFQPPRPGIVTASGLRATSTNEAVPAVYLFAVAGNLNVDPDSLPGRLKENELPPCLPGGCRFGSVIVELKPQR